MKKFITTISLQGKDLSKIVYVSEKNEITYCTPTCFPIINIIENNVCSCDKIKIYAIIITGETDGESSNQNFILFKNELAELSAKSGFSYSIEIIDKFENDDVNTSLKLFSKLIDIPKDNDEISACITYGTKPISVLTIMALHYSYKVKNNVNIKNIVYGKKNWGKDSNTGILINVTPLFYIDCAIDSLARLNLENPAESIKAILETEE